jgi:hypothetical protein
MMRIAKMYKYSQMIYEEKNSECCTHIEQNSTCISKIK